MTENKQTPTSNNTAPQNIERDSLAATALTPFASSSGKSEAAAENSTQAAKNMYSGQLSVNLNTGTASIQFQLPDFAKLGLSLSYSSVAAKYDSPFMMPAGVNFMAVPFVHLGPEDIWALNLNGQDFYLDPKYASILTERDCKGDLYFSGLKYQASKNVYFQDFSKQSDYKNLVIHSKKGDIKQIEYAYQLEVFDGEGGRDSFFFDQDGFCFAVANKFFNNDSHYNYKYVTQIEYEKDATADVLYSKLKAFIDPDENRLEFNYANGNQDITFSYPAGSSGESYQAYILKQSSDIILGHSLDDKNDYRLILDTDVAPLNFIEEVFYNKLTDNSVVNTRYFLDYEDSKNPYAVTKKRVHDGKDRTKTVTTLYDYTGQRQDSFTYGVDIAYDARDINTLVSTYETVETTGQYQTIHYYNQLSLEIKTEVRSLNSTTGSPYGDLIYETIHIFLSVDGYDEADEPTNLLANYEFSTTTYTVFYDKCDDEKIMPAAVTKKENRYGDYSNLLSEETYPIIKFDHFNEPGRAEIKIPAYSDDIKPITQNTYAYDSTYVTEIGKKETDYSTGNTQTVINTLTEDSLNIENSRSWAKKQGEDEIQDLKTIQCTYAKDGQSYADSNYHNNATVLSKKEAFPQDDDNSITTSYNYNMDENSDPKRYGSLEKQTTIKVLSAPPVADATTIETSINNCVIKQVPPMGLVTTAEFDVSFNQISEDQPTGVSLEYIYNYAERTYTSKTLDINGENSYINEIINYDFLGQELSKYKRCERASQVSTYLVEKTTYDYKNGPRIDANFDENGNKEEVSYDNYRGLVNKRAQYLKDKNNELEFSGETTFDYSIGSFDNSIKNSFIMLTETLGGEKGKVTISKGLSEDIVYEQTQWIGTQIKSKQIQEYSLSGTLEKSSLFVADEKNSEDTMILRSCETYNYDVLNRLGHSIQEFYDDAENVVHKTNTAIEYDLWSLDQEVSRTVSANDARCSTYRSHYNLLGKKVRKSYLVDDKELSTQDTFNSGGMIIESVDFNKNVTTSDYDSKTGLLLSTQFKHEKTELSDEVTNKYDDFAALCEQMSGRSFSYKESFSLIGLSKNIQFLNPDHLKLDGEPKSSSSTYDDLNRIQTYTNTSGLLSKLIYLPNGELDTVLIHNSSNQQIASIENFYYSYDKDQPLSTNNLKECIFQFETDNVTFKQTSQFTYDEQGRLKEEGTDDGTRIIKTIYTYNRLDQVIIKENTTEEKSSSNQIVSTEECYTYDERNQLIASQFSDKLTNKKTSQTYLYDNFSNIKQQLTKIEWDEIENTAIHFSYNNVNQLLTKEIETKIDNKAPIKQTTEYSYDDNGNVISEKIQTGQNSGHETTYTYNAKNQLTAIENNAGTFDYAYFTTGQRALKQHDDQAILFYYDVNGELITSDLVGTKDGIEILKQDSFINEYRYIQDLIEKADELQVGHMRLNKSTCTTIATSDDQVNYQQLSISDYGLVTHEESASVGKDTLDFMQYPYLYGAGYFDSESALQYMQARYYSPLLKRFLAQDNADYEELPNRYIYALSNPVMNYDLDGHVSFQQILAITAAVTVTAVGFAMSPATAGGSDALALELDMAILSSEVAAASTLTAEASAATAVSLSQASEFMNMGIQVGWNAVYSAGFDGALNAAGQMFEGNDFSWGSFFSAAGSGAISGALFGGVYGTGAQDTKKIVGSLSKTNAKIANVGLYTLASVSSSVTDTLVSNGFNGKDATDGLLNSFAIGAAKGVAVGSVATNVSRATISSKKAGSGNKIRMKMLRAKG
jgi:RHS repeat-associated protein